MINNFDDRDLVRRYVETGQHRELVGGLWDEIGRLSLQFLIDRGLRPDHYFLDVGCGCLRVGMLLIEYLDEGHYFGVDSSEDLLRVGYETELSGYGLNHKLPRQNLLCDEEFRFERLPEHPPFDMALAQSLFTHLPLNHIRLCLLRLAPAMRSGAPFFATVFHCRDDAQWGRPLVHERGGTMSFPARDPYHYRSADLNAAVSGLPWTLEPPIDWNHPNDHAVVEFVRQDAPASVVVLGMHRSGTSSLTGCLAEAGLELGDVNQEAPYNRRGNQEDRRIMELHDDVLLASGGTWLDPPDEVIWTDAHRKRRDALIAEHGTGTVWGFKDPRTLLTVEGWLEALPGLRAVGTFRHPAAVAASLEARDGLPYEQALALWRKYNERLLRHHDRFGCELVSFDLSPEDYRARVSEIARKVGLTPPEEGFGFFDTHLRHHAAPPARPLPPDVETIYRRLLAISESQRRKTELSVVVVVYDMAREAPRTLRSLTPTYQKGMEGTSYEVIVVDNGSPVPLSEHVVSSLGPNFRYIYVDEPAPSPAGAVNLGVRHARGEHLGILIDGARIATPGMLASALDCLRGFPRAVVGTVGFHLGPDVQIRAKQHGYDQSREDELLTSIDWPRDGYRLFEIAALAASSENGWLGPMNESNCLFMPRALFDELGGYDEGFDLPGGGFANLDFWARACALPDSMLFTLAGEATFHQFHGGAATGVEEEALAERLSEWGHQYAQIRGREFKPSRRPPRLFGEIPPQALPWMRGPKTWDDAPKPTNPDGAGLHELNAVSTLRSVLSSRSWRLTAPLRKLAARMRGNR